MSFVSESPCPYSYPCPVQVDIYIFGQFGSKKVDSCRVRSLSHRPPSLHIVPTIFTVSLFLRALVFLYFFFRFFSCGETLLSRLHAGIIVCGRWHIWQAVLHIEVWGQIPFDTGLFFLTYGGRGSDPECQTAIIINTT